MYFDTRRSHVNMQDLICKIGLIIKLFLCHAFRKWLQNFDPKYRIVSKNITKIISQKHIEQSLFFFFFNMIYGLTVIRYLVLINWDLIKKFILEECRLYPCYMPSGKIIHVFVIPLKNHSSSLD